MKERGIPAAYRLIFAMFLFGTIGIFVRGIALPSGVIALLRGAIGTLFLLLLTVLRGRRVSGADIRRNLGVLAVSGALIGFNWILLFEAYRYTTVATATLCYYLAPVFVILASPLVLKERLTLRKLLCVAAALLGMVLISGVSAGAARSLTACRGILLGVGAALLYAAVVLLNQKLRNISAYDRTIVQLGAASLVLLPYVLLTGGFSGNACTPRSVALLLIVGVLHTGFAYALYFGAMRELPAQTVAIFSYIDPIVAILLSALLLKEPMTLLQAAGAVLVLGATFFSEQRIRREPKTENGG